jgi:AcrR family transcriptional regulator
MPKGFTDKEKQIIRETLLREAEKLFDQYGVQKTTVEDITKASGISKGSFYLFYNSKEELFFDIMESIEKDIKKIFFNDIFPESSNRRESFKEFIKSFISTIDNTSIFKILNTQDLQYLLRKLPEHRIAEHMQHDNEVFIEFYNKWNRKGIFRDLDIKGFNGVMKLLFYLLVHKDEYTEDEFEATKNIFIDMLAEYLVIK